MMEERAETVGGAHGRPLLVGVIGSDDHSGEEITAAAIEAAEQLGRRVADLGAVVISGGRGGIMEAASRGAYRAGGVVVGLLPGFDRSDANAFLTLPLCTGMGAVRNHLTIAASDVVVMIAGSTGTLNEATIAYGQKPLIVVTGTGGWSDRLREMLYRGLHFDQRGSATVSFVPSAEEAVELAVSLAPEGTAVKHPS